MIMAINGNDQQQTTLATMNHTQGDGCVVLWLIVVLVPIVVFFVWFWLFKPGMYKVV
jgi:hypothetical protein